MKTAFTVASVLFAIVAAYFLFSGFTLETTFEGQANLQLMHIQSLNFMTGIGAAIISAIFGSASAFAR
jgi:uncharacterized membrane protein